MGVVGDFIDKVTGATKRREEEAESLRRAQDDMHRQAAIDRQDPKAQKVIEDEAGRVRLRENHRSPAERLPSPEVEAKVRERIDTGRPQQSREEPSPKPTPEQQIDATRMELQRTPQPAPVVLGPGQTAAPNPRSWKPPSPAPENGPDGGPDNSPTPSPAAAKAAPDPTFDMVAPLSPEEHRQWAKAYGEHKRSQSQDRERSRQ